MFDRVQNTFLHSANSSPCVAYFPFNKFHMYLSNLGYTKSQCSYTNHLLTTLLHLFDQIINFWLHHDDKLRQSIYVYKTFSVNDPNG